jgi:predicted HicB family RNase H-like nuclease
MKDVIKYKDFVASVHFSSEDEVFHGKIEGIDDSITFEGGSVKALKDAFIEAVNDYLEICREIGKDPHKSYKGSFNIRIKPDLHKQAAYKSVELGLSLNQLVEEAISSYISKKSSPSG